MRAVVGNLIFPAAKPWGGGPSAGGWRGSDVAQLRIRQRSTLPPPHSYAKGRVNPDPAARSWLRKGVLWRAASLAINQNMALEIGPR